MEIQCPYELHSITTMHSGRGGGLISTVLLVETAGIVLLENVNFFVKLACPHKAFMVGIEN